MALTIRYSISRIGRHWTRCTRKFFHEDYNYPEKKDAQKQCNANYLSQLSSAAAMANKYRVFRDVDATVILDIEEERQNETSVNADIRDKSGYNKLTGIYNGINLNRGRDGVFDIEDLVTVLRLNNAGNIFVCSVPKKFKYVDYICLVTGISQRHMRGIAEFIRKVYKIKRKPEEIIPKIEGENSPDWMAIDLGNIVLHIFSAKAREQYDLESLWSVGKEYDSDYNNHEELLVKLFERHTAYLNDLKPLKVT